MERLQVSDTGNYYVAVEQYKVFSLMKLLNFQVQILHLREPNSHQSGYISLGLQRTLLRLDLAGYQDNTELTKIYKT